MYEGDRQISVLLYRVQFVMEVFKWKELQLCFKDKTVPNLYLSSSLHSRHIVRSPNASSGELQLFGCMVV